MADFDFREFCRAWALDSEAVCQGRLVPSPSGYFWVIVGRDRIDRIASELKLTAIALAGQLETDTVDDEHWPTILQAELFGRQRSEQMGEAEVSMFDGAFPYVKGGKQE